MKCQAGWITSWNQDCGEKYQYLHICMWHHTYGRRWKGIISLLMKVKRGEWKSWLKTQHSKNVDDIQSHHSMANRWGNNGNSDRRYFGGSKITVDSDGRHEIKRHLLLGRKAMTNLDSILKSRDTTLPAKVCLVTTVFPVVMYGCESCIIKQDEHWRINTF